MHQLWRLTKLRLHDSLIEESFLPARQEFPWKDRGWVGYLVSHTTTAPAWSSFQEKEFSCNAFRWKRKLLCPRRLQIQSVVKMMRLVCTSRCSRIFFNALKQAWSTWPLYSPMQKCSCIDLLPDRYMPLFGLILESWAGDDLKIMRMQKQHPKGPLQSQQECRTTPQRATAVAKASSRNKQC